MYPKISDLINDLTGLHISLPFYTYGFCLGLAILTSAALTGRELERRRLAPAWDVMPVLLAMVLILGPIGSRVFFILESGDAFLANPWRTITSRTGLSFYGGLLLAGPAIVGYVRRRGIPVGRFVDAAAPTILLAYGIARIGCQLSGDGDWGIPADMDLKPGWLPTWLWAETYPGNVAAVKIPPPGVYPTPIYETAACFVLAAILFRLREHRWRGGWLFSLMLVAMGFERFWIEKIRVNPRFELLGLHPTQAEIISIVLMAAGAWGLHLCRRPQVEALPRAARRRAARK